MDAIAVVAAAAIAISIAFVRFHFLFNDFIIQIDVIFSPIPFIVCASFSAVSVEHAGSLLQIQFKTNVTFFSLFLSYSTIIVLPIERIHRHRHSHRNCIAEFVLCILILAFSSKSRANAKCDAFETSVNDFLKSTVYT